MKENVSGCFFLNTVYIAYVCGFCRAVDGVWLWRNDE